jgi:folate-dependent tRNA-U54 methylase TrmFO/GidA
MYTSPSNDKTKELLDTAVSIAGSKTISYSDFLNSPITNIDSLMQSIQDFLKKKYGKGKSDYLDDFQEELE